MSIFSRPPRFNPVDPLGGGLREMIEHERAEPERIELTEHLNARELESHWNTIHQDLLEDPLWFSQD